MRRFALLTLSISALALSACGMIPGTEKPETAKPAAEAAAPAAAMKASASEEKEMAAVMGGEAPAPDAVPVEPVTAEATAGTNPTDPLAAMDRPAAMPADTEVTSAEHAAAPAPENRTPVAGAPTECPGVEVLPDTKSITYFDDPEGKPTGALVARATLVDIKGGCDYTADGLVVDIDMIMQGRITDKGRYEGRQDLEAFMTFPYFVAIMDPNGKMIDKKIMATAMRFKPQIDDLDHAEKITQTIPLTNIAEGPKYTITVGFQLNRAQLDYNRGSVSPPTANVKPGAKKAAEPAAAHEDNKPKKPAEKMSNDPLAESKKAKPASSAKTTETTTTDKTTKTESTSPAAPAAVQSSGSKMKPITE